MQILLHSKIMKIVSFILLFANIFARVYIPPSEKITNDKDLNLNRIEDNNDNSIDINFLQDNSDEELDKEVDELFTESPKERMLKDKHSKQKSERKLNQTFVQKPITQMIPQYTTQTQPLYQTQYVPIVTQPNLSMNPLQTFANNTSPIQPIYVQQPPAINSLSQTNIPFNNQQTIENISTGDNNKNSLAANNNKDGGNNQLKQNVENSNNNNLKKADDISSSNNNNTFKNSNNIISKNEKLEKNVKNSNSIKQSISNKEKNIKRKLWWGRKRHHHNNRRHHHNNRRHHHNNRRHHHNNRRHHHNNRRHHHHNPQQQQLKRMRSLKNRQNLKRTLQLKLKKNKFNDMNQQEFEKKYELKLKSATELWNRTFIYDAVLLTEKILYEDHQKMVDNRIKIDEEEEKKLTLDIEEFYNKYKGKKLKEIPESALDLHIFLDY